MTQPNQSLSLPPSRARPLLSSRSHDRRRLHTLPFVMYPQIQNHTLVTSLRPSRYRDPFDKRSYFLRYFWSRQPLWQRLEEFSFFELHNCWRVLT